MKALAAAVALACVLRGLALGASFGRTAQTNCAHARAAVSAKVKSIPVVRKRYFRKHRKAADRKRFVAAQQKALRHLRAVAAAACATTTTRTTPPPTAPCPPTLADNGNTYLGEGGPSIDFNLHPHAVGTIKATMIFVDFPDKPADAAPDPYWNLLAPGADYLRDESYGRLQLSITPILRWFRMPSPSSAYGFGSGLTHALQTAYIRQAVAVADPSVDFSGSSYIYVVGVRGSAIPNSPAYIGTATDAVTADGTTLRDGTTFGNDIWTNDRWGWHILAHETSHTFGLPDLYDFNFDPMNYHQQFDHVGGWSIMSWSEPAGESFAWEKYRLGWLDKDQLHCVDAGSTTQTITPLETSGGLKAVIVQTGPSTADLVEVRQLRAGDAGLCDNGVLVYRVDATIPTGHGPIELVTRGTGTEPAQVAKCSLHYDAPLDLRPGKPATYEDAKIRVELLATGADGSYSVRVTKK